MSRIRKTLLHEWIEQGIVKYFERLEGLDGFRRPDQYSDSGPLARNTIAICAGCRTGCGHKRLEAPGMRFKQPDIARRDDMMGCNPIAASFSVAG
jgi:hypothetical protein